MSPKSDFDKLLEKGTSPLLLEPDWQCIMLICDLIRQGDVKPSYILAGIKKKISHENPHVATFALQVLESVVKNCGSPIHTELASKDFMEFLKSQATNRPDQVRNKVAELMQVWAHAFRNDPKYRAVCDTFNLMKHEGVKFPALVESDAMFSAETAPEWKDGENCFRCKDAFGMLNRKLREQPPELRGELAQHGAVLAAYLASCGADPFKRNMQGKTPLDLVMDSRLDEVIRNFSAKHHMSLVESETFTQPADCLVCDAAPVEVRFDPCGHMPVCSDCCSKMRRCIQCKVPIVHKRHQGSNQTPTESQPFPEPTTSHLHDKLQSLEESLMCTICMDRNKSVAFLCGHQACSQCAQSLKQCHMCRKTITKRINLF